MPVYGSDTGKHIIFLGNIRRHKILRFTMFNSNSLKKDHFLTTEKNYNNKNTFIFLFAIYNIKLGNILVPSLLQLLLEL